MAETLPRHLLYGFIVLSIVLVGAINLISIIGAGNPTIIENTKFMNFNESMNKIDTITNNVGELESTASGLEATSEETNGGILGFLDNLVKNVWISVRALFTSFSFMGDAIDGLSLTFGIPTWITTLLGLLITVLVIFSIYSAIFQRDI